MEMYAYICSFTMHKNYRLKNRAIKKIKVGLLQATRPDKGIIKTMLHPFQVTDPSYNSEVVYVITCIASLFPQ